MPNNELNDVQQDLEAYLIEQTTDGQQYFKSKYIADDLDLTSKSVGTNLGILQEKTDRVDIESWSGGSSGITWLVTAAEEPVNSPRSKTPAPRKQLAIVSDD